jgi:hypothetical protein
VRGGSLAERAGLSVATLRDLEQGRTRHPRRPSVQALVGALRSAPDAAATWLAAAAVGPSTPPNDLEPVPADPVRVNVLGPLTVRRGGARGGDPRAGTVRRRLNRFFVGLLEPDA